MIAVSHPGRIGDALYALPALQQLCLRHQCKADFYTSSWCEPLRQLMLDQPEVNEFIVPKEYVIKEHSIGIQPWSMPIPIHKYVAVYQLGYKAFPTVRLPEWMCHDVGVPFTGLKMTYKQWPIPVEPYIVMCSRSINEFGHYFYQTNGALREIASRVKTFVVGLDAIREPSPVFDYIPIPLDKMPHLIAGAKGFIGQGSSVHTIATFMPVKRAVLILPFTDKRHIYRDSNDLFVQCPICVPNEILAHFGL